MPTAMASECFRTRPDRDAAPARTGATVERLGTETGLTHAPSGVGDYVTGIYRQRVTLASGRFAMIDDGLGFQLVPWRPALEQKLGQHVSGTMLPNGGVDWSFGRQKELGI